MKHRQVGPNRVGVVNRDGHTIGLDIGATAVRATVLTPGTLDGHPSVTISAAGKVELAEGIVVNGVVQDSGALTAAVKLLWRKNKLNCHNVILGVTNQQASVRHLTMPDLSPRQRAKALPFQAQEIIALPLEQVVLDFCQLGEVDPDTNMVSGLLLATPREPVLSAVTAVERAGLKVARVDLSSLGSLRSIADENLAVEAIIDLGAHLTTVVIHDHGVPKLIRTLARGGQGFTEQLADRMNISVREAEIAKCDVGLLGAHPELTRMLTDALRPLLAEIRSSVQYYRATGDSAALERVSLTGGGARLRGIETAFTEQLGLPTLVVDPMRHVRNRAAASTGDVAHDVSAVSIGLAMGRAA